MSNREESFILNLKSYLKAVQERVAAFFFAIDYENIEEKTKEACNLYIDIVLSEKDNLKNIINDSQFKNDDKNFMKRKGYRAKETFAFDLMTNWVYERMIIPYLHLYLGLNSSECYLNPETCDSDAKLGWDSNSIRKINSNYDFITDAGEDKHHIELKSMFIHNRYSANFKVFCEPKDSANLDKYHIVFCHFDGLGNIKSESPDLSNFNIYHIPWMTLKNCHIHYPPQLDGKPCYLVHFKGDNECVLYGKNGGREIKKIDNSSECFYIDDVIISKKIRYDDLKPYLILDLNYNDILGKILS